MKLFISLAVVALAAFSILRGAEAPSQAVAKGPKDQLAGARKLIDRIAKSEIVFLGARTAIGGELIPVEDKLQGGEKKWLGTTFTVDAGDMYKGTDLYKKAFGEEPQTFEVYLPGSLSYVLTSRLGDLNLVFARIEKVPGPLQAYTHTENIIVCTEIEAVADIGHELLDSFFLP